jgi:4-amino-4-deoxy-L-arabinose transferase-like glycosyltransferase
LGLIGRNEPWVLRLVSAVFGVLTVVAFYYFSREILDESTGRLAALLMATSVWHINVSRIGTRPVSCVCFLLWALYLFWRSTRRLAEGSRWYWLGAIGGGLLYGLGFHTYIAYRITPLMVAAILPGLSRRYGVQRVLKVGAIFFAMTVLAALPLALYFLRHQSVFADRTMQLSITATANPLHEFLGNVGKILAMYTAAGDKNWRHNLSGHPMLFFPVGVLFLLGVGLAAWRQHWLLGFWAAAALPAILSAEGTPNALRSVLTLPAVLLAAAMGGVWLWRCLASVWPVRFMQGLACVFAVTLVVAAYRTYFVTWGPHPMVAAYFYEKAVAHAQSLREAPPEIPKYIFLAPESANYVRGLPGSGRVMMFLTDTFSQKRQQELQIHYLVADRTNDIARGWVYVDFVPPPVAF